MIDKIIFKQLLNVMINTSIVNFYNHLGASHLCETNRVLKNILFDVIGICEYRSIKSYMHVHILYFILKRFYLMYLNVIFYNYNILHLHGPIFVVY